MYRSPARLTRQTGGLRIDANTAKKNAGQAARHFLPVLWTERILSTGTRSGTQPRKYRLEHVEVGEVDDQLALPFRAHLERDGRGEAVR